MTSTDQENKLVLYSSWNSSCSWRVRFALNLKGISYVYKAVNFVKKEQFSEEYERVNPLHLVPALADGDVMISDSFAILLYLEEKFPEKPLLPSDPQLKGLNLQKKIEEKGGPQAKLDFARHHIEKGFQALEKLLNHFTTKYATGEEVSLGDVFLAPQIANAMERFNIEMSNYPTLSRLYESYKILPEYEASLPDRQPDAVVSA